MAMIRMSPLKPTETWGAKNPPKPLHPLIAQGFLKAIPIKLIQNHRNVAHVKQQNSNSNKATPETEI